MSAHVTKEEISLLIPHNLSHYFKDDPEYMVVPEGSGTGVFTKLVGAVRWLIDMPRRRAVLDELCSLTDHELTDIGLDRSDLSRIFESGFSAERNAERAMLAGRMPSTI